MTFEPPNPFIVLLCLLIHLILLLAGCSSRLAEQDIKPVTGAALPVTVKAALASVQGDPAIEEAYGMVYLTDTIWIAPSMDKRNSNCYYVHHGRVFYVGITDSFLHAYQIGTMRKISFFYKRKPDGRYQTSDMMVQQQCDYGDYTCNLFLQEPCLSRLQNTYCREDPFSCLAWVVKCL